MTRRGAAALAAAWLALACPAAGLEAAAGSVDITPLKGERAYLAGYGASGRRAAGADDPLKARLLVLREGRVQVALAAFDLIGVGLPDVDGLRRRSGYDKQGRYLLAAATHQHTGPDTLGLWGPWPGASGRDPRYLERIMAAVAAELSRLEARLEPASAAGGEARLSPEGLCRDRRDPRVLDPYAARLLLRARRGGRSLATVVRWSCHPTARGRRGRTFSADFPGELCLRVEERGGGECLFFNGTVGGRLVADAGEGGAAESSRIGRAVADAALASPLSGGGRPLAARSRRLLLRLDNPRFLALLPVLARGRPLFDAAGRPLGRARAAALALRQLVLGAVPEKERPWLQSEVSLVDVGPARLLGLPGEAFPEAALGGFGGELSFGGPLIAPGNAAPPDLARAPRGPGLRARLRAAAPMVVGLANDELGYLVPSYDFRAAPGRLMLGPAPGGRYDEGFSPGESASAAVVEAAENLLREATP